MTRHDQRVVVVGYDGGAESVAAARWALGHAQDTRLLAVVAAGDDGETLEVAHVVEVWDRDRESFGDRAELVVERGPAAGALTRAAVAHAATMIVIGHRQTREGASVARELVDQAPCPVAVIGTGTCVLDAPHAPVGPRWSFATAVTGDVMHPHVISCPPTATVREAAAVMAAHRVHCVVISGIGTTATGGERLVWRVLDDLDLVRVAADAASDADVVRASDVASVPATTVSPDDPLIDVARIMSGIGATHLVVASDRRAMPVGVISAQDLARALAAEPHDERPAGAPRR